LTSLPPPHRAPAHLVREFLSARFPDPYLTVGPERIRELIAELAERGIVGGSAYDALIAAVARGAAATLLTCDRRAEGTYARIGAAVRFLG
jgi:predicted nucleic acid-binding protein